MEYFTRDQIYYFLHVHCLWIPCLTNKKCLYLAFVFSRKWFRCSQPWLLSIFESQKHCLLNIRVRSKFLYLEYSVLLLELCSYTYHEYLGKFIHRRRRESFRFQRRAEIKPRFILPEKKFGQPWLLLTVQYLVCILPVAIFAWSCVRVRPKNFLPLSLFFFFQCSPMKIRPGQAEKNEKASSLYRLRQSTIA